MKTIKCALVAGLLASTALSANAGGQAKKAMSYDDFVFKARVGYVGASDKVKNVSGDSTRHDLKNGFAGEVVGEYFFSRNVAVEASVGYMRMDLKRTATNDNKKDAVTLVPLTATLQYHLMPTEAFSPYVGAGYSYQVASGGPSGTKIKNGGGAVAQVGVDIPMNDTFGLNVDVKYTHKAKHNLRYNTAGNTYKTEVSTVSALAGVTFPF